MAFTRNAIINFSAWFMGINKRLLSNLTVKPVTHPKISVSFSVLDAPGALKNILTQFEKHHVNMTRIESRPSKILGTFDFFTDFEGDLSSQNIKKLLTELKDRCKNVSVMGSKEVPWFPRKASDLNLVSQNIFTAGIEISHPDHPGFHDAAYRERRKNIAKVAMNHKYGNTFEKVHYSAEEHAAWNTIWNKLIPLQKKYACDDHRKVFKLLESNCGWNQNEIPQLGPISQFLKECTGFTLCPVGGLLSARDFFNGLAFRVFFCTQYIRHPSKPLYTPEPDVVHELLGHAPLFADSDFADFSQEIGLASVGASDEVLTKLARLYWYTVEFGLCRQGHDIKVYGAGILSSPGEIEHSMNSKDVKIVPFDPYEAVKHDFPITTYQPTLYLAESFADACKKFREYALSLERPFHVAYNPLTQTLEVDRNIRVIGNAPKRATSL